MPLYEYFCPSCKNSFESLRPVSQSDQPAACPSCQQESGQRILSLVATNVVKSSGGSNEAFTPAMSRGGGGCCGGACGCH